MSHPIVVKPRQITQPKTSVFWQSLPILASFLCIATLTPSHLTKAASPPAPLSADWGPTTYSFGGAAAAMSSNHDSFLTNPAGLFYFSGRSSLGGSYQTMPGDQTGWTTSLVDGSHDIIGGFQFAWADIGDLNRQNYTIGSAYKTPYGAVGVSIHATRFRGTMNGRGWHFTNSMGAIVPLGEMLTLGIYSKSPYDLEKDRYLPPSVHMGVMYSRPGALRATFESGRRFQVAGEDWYYAAAGDFLFQEYLALRGGYRWDHRSENSFWSTGACIIAPKIEITGVYIRTENDSDGYGFDISLKF